LIGWFVAGVLGAIVTGTEAQPGGAPAAGPASGQTTFASKCFQCHSAAMWADLRHDRRGWEGVLYRMVGRGALWTEDEIRGMAEYLATAFGRETGKPSR
jgi:mono/diheme cytochrome c family protein